MTGYVIRCKVSGGVTGTRESIVKDINGQVMRFETREAAEAQARIYAESANGNPFRTASFWYWAAPEIG